MSKTAFIKAPGIIGIVFFACMNLVCCKNNQNEAGLTVSDKESIRIQIHNIFKDFSKAYANLDVDLVAGLYMDDALYLTGNKEILRGRSEISKEFKRYFDWALKENARLDLSFDFREEIITPQMCNVVGYYLIVTDQQRPGGSSQRKSCGKFIAVFQKDKSGQWKFISDAYNEAPVDAFKKS